MKKPPYSRCQPEGKPLSEVFSRESTDEFRARVTRELDKARERFMEDASDAAFLGDTSLLKGRVKSIFAQIESSRQWARRWKALAKKSRLKDTVKDTPSGLSDKAEHSTEDLIVRAAMKFVRAAKYAREADVRRARTALEGDPVEHLGLLEDYHRAMAALAGAEQDLILAVEEHEEDGA